MKKKVDVRDLQWGVFVSELDRPWIETPFLFQGFELSTPKELEHLKKHCKYVYIDTDLGPDIKIKSGNREMLQRMRILEEQDRQIARSVRELAEKSLPRHKRKPYEDLTTFEDELITAREIEKETRSVIQDMLQDAEKGALDLTRASKAVENMSRSTMRNPDALMCLSQLKDVSEYAALHSMRATILALAFGRHLVYTKDELHTLGMGALLHDIGMAKVPKEILEKNGALNDAEFEQVRKHVFWGSEMVMSAGDASPMTIGFIEQHHERHDGSGYPYQRQDKMIATDGAIGAIIDVYDAITSDRGYAGGLSAEDALRKLYEWRHKDFNAALVEDFIKCMGIFPIGSLVELSTGSIGVVVTINRSRRLKPKVAVVLTPSKTPYSHTMLIDLMDSAASHDRELKIKRVLPAGSFGINPMEYIVQL